jgi:hypothetical protein
VLTLVSGSVCVTLDLLSAESAGMTAHINAAMAANNDKVLVIRLCFICLVGVEFYIRSVNAAANATSNDCLIWGARLGLTPCEALA